MDNIKDIIGKNNSFMELINILDSDNIKILNYLIKDDKILNIFNNILNIKDKSDIINNINKDDLLLIQNFYNNESNKIII